MRTTWTPDEETYLLANWKTQSDTELSEHLGRSKHSVNNARDRLNLFRRTGSVGVKRTTWTKEEETCLMDAWGAVSIPGIAKKLGRTINAVKVHAQRLGLGAVLESGDYVTWNQLIKEVTGGKSSKSYQMNSWVKKRGFPIHTKRVLKNSFRVVYLNEFWMWAEQHRAFIDFSKMEPLSLGEEPAWVAQQRRIDAVSFANQRKDRWTDYEDQRLAHLLKQNRYSWSEISREMTRSAGAIQRRCCDLGLKERPVRADPYNPWSDADLQTLADMLRQGRSYSMIGDAVGRSEKAVRGVVYQKYHTENADKIRTMLGSGPWGTGAPAPTVKSEKHKETVRKPVARLCELLLIHRNAVGWDPYWQRSMCQHWDDVKGCLMQQHDCDSCTKFQRIRPQYCVRCGETFFERTQQKYCARCRQMRKKQAQRKYAVLSRRGKV